MAEEVFRILQEQSAGKQSIGILEFRIRPDADALALDMLMEAIAAEFDRRNFPAWVMDLTQVSFLNSAGLGLLVNIRQKVRQSHGKLALCGLSPSLLQLFQSCCLERLFTIERTRPLAIAAVSK